MLSFLPTSLLRVVASFGGGGGGGEERRERGERGGGRERGSKSKGQLLATQLRPALRRAAQPARVVCLRGRGRQPP